MKERPILNNRLDGKTFREFYYLKEELVDFCRKNGLPAAGAKTELTDRIAYFLDTGVVQSALAAKKKSAPVGKIDEDMIIEPDFVCSEAHRTFFKEHIGNQFTFHVAFQKWLRANTGRTYREAIAAYYRIMEDKKKGKTVIEKQFEYNTYIRDFFAHNKGKSLTEAIQCWKYKKQLQGHNRYENADLAALAQREGRDE